MATFVLNRSERTARQVGGAPVAEAGFTPEAWQSLLDFDAVDCQWNQDIQLWELTPPVQHPIVLLIAGAVVLLGGYVLIAWLLGRLVGDLTGGQ